MNADIRDESALDKIFNIFKPEAVIHFAGLKAVGERVANPMIDYHVFEDTSGVLIKFKYLPRSEGALAAFWVDSSKAFEKTSWKPERNIKKICEDTWRWQKYNIIGYGKNK